MSDYDRQFARRHITWKLTDVTRESSNWRRTSPNIQILLGDNKTEWNVKIFEKDQHLAIFLNKARSDRTDFTVTFNAAVLKMSPALSYEFSRGFTEHAKNFENSGGWGVPKFVPLEALFDEKNQLLVNNELAIDIQLELIEDAKLEMPLLESPPLDNFERLINNEKYSDFVFICSDDEKVFVHKAIIAAHCEAFATMIEAGLSETKTNSATITDVDSETMLELVRFLYCRRVSNMEQIQERLVIAANKYGIEDLKNFCVSSLMESLTDENVFEIFEIAELLGEEHLKNNCVDYLKCHQLRLQNVDKEEFFSAELSWALWKSVDLHPTRIWLKDEESM